MNKKSIPALVTLALSTTSGTSVFAAQQYFEARNDAMGGTGIASSHYLAAPLANPALLARFGSDDDIGLLLPAVGILGSDEDETIDGVDSAADLFDELNEFTTDSFLARAKAQQLADELDALDGDQVPVQVGASAVLAIPSEHISLALFAHSYADLIIEPNIDDADTAALRSPTPTALTELGSSVIVTGAGVTDVGITLASSFILGTTPAYVGVSPKFQTIGIYEYESGIEDFDTDQIVDDENFTTTSAFNVDFGFVLEPSEHFTFGLAAKNLIEREITAVNSNITYRVEPQITTGFALHNKYVTAAVDIDVTQSRNFAVGGYSQYARFGAEIDAGGWVQLRGGYRHDLDENSEDLITFGLGLAPFETLHLDVTAMVGDNETYGLVAQTSFTF